MLVTPKPPALFDHQLDIIYNIIGQPPGQWTSPGVYTQSGFRDPPGSTKRAFGRHTPHGVCDNLQQILEKFPIINHPSMEFCISMTQITKADQPKEYGWRWHKWGDYIGTHDIKCEYLYDEADIEYVYVFHVHLDADNRSYEEKIEELNFFFDENNRNYGEPRIVKDKVLALWFSNDGTTAKELVVLDYDDTPYWYLRYYDYNSTEEAREALLAWEYSDDNHPPGNWSTMRGTFLTQRNTEITNPDYKPL